MDSEVEVTAAGVKVEAVTVGVARGAALVGGLVEEVRVAVATVQVAQCRTCT